MSSTKERRENNVLEKNFTWCDRYSDSYDTLLSKNRRPVVSVCYDSYFSFRKHGSLLVYKKEKWKLGSYFRANRRR